MTLSHVVIVMEEGHDQDRPLDGRPHISPKIRARSPLHSAHILLYVAGAPTDYLCRLGSTVQLAVSLVTLPATSRTLAAMV